MDELSGAERDARDRRASEIFLRACDLGESERKALLDEATSGDEALRARVEALLAADLAPLDLANVASGGGLRAEAGALAERLEATARAEAVLERFRAPERLGSYRVLGPLGRGAASLVLEAEQDRPRRRVALKLLPGFASPAALRRFRQEAEVLANLSHPGIAQVYDAGTFEDGDEKLPYIAMELVDGVRLDEYAQRPELTLRDRIELIAAVADAVEHAHQKGVIHRDLKPANILVDRFGRPRLLDFGIARVRGLDLPATTIHTEHGQLMGTIAYMSPEQVQGDAQAIDARSDVYALGVILYELLAGRRPHALESVPLASAARIVEEDEPERLGTVDRRLKGDIEHIVMKALEKDRARRYGSAGDLALDLRRFLHDEPVLARPPSLPYRLGKYARRHRAALGGALAATVILTAGLGLPRLRLLKSTGAQPPPTAAAVAFRSYVALVQGALSAILEHDPRTARSRLASAPQELRNWEWRHLRRRAAAGPPPRLSGADIVGSVLGGHGAAVLAVAWSPDGNLIATGSADGTARLWDGVSGAPLATLAASTGALPDGESVAAAVAAVSFRDDGSILATGASDGRVRLWDAATGEMLTELTHLAGVRAVAFAPGTELLASGGDGGVVYVWRSRSGERLAVLRLPGGVEGEEPADPVTGLAWSADGRRLASAHQDGEIRVWDVDGHELVAELKDSQGGVRAVRFWNRTRTILSAGADGTLRIWDVGSARVVATLSGHQGGAEGVAIHPDGTRLASVGADGRLRLWDTRVLEEVVSFRDESPASYAVAFSPDGSRIATGSTEPRLRLWDTVAIAARERGARARSELFDVMEPRVVGLLRDLGSPAAVAARLTVDPELGVAARSAARAALLARAASTRPASILRVNTTADTIAADGHCSLREALRAANGDIAVDTCPAGRGADVILLPAGRFRLARPGAGDDSGETGDLDITSDVTIRGAGAGRTVIDGGGLDRVIHVPPGAAWRIEISDLSLVHGRAEKGGGLGNGSETTATATVLIHRVEVADNTAVDGGGIYNGAGGTLVVEQSTVSGNTAISIHGGGILNDGTLVVVSSTVSGNRAGGSGGGIASFVGDLLVSGSTVTANQARSAGGLCCNGRIVVRNSILSGNLDGSGHADDAASFSTGGHNLLGRVFPTLGDASSDVISTRPLLGPLGLSGGPTRTHLPLVGSPAIGAGNPAPPGSDGGACEAADQRGVQRGVRRGAGRRCDIGAVQVGGR